MTSAEHTRAHHTSFKTAHAMNQPTNLTRRHFLRTGSLAAPAIITAATTLRAQQKADSNETLRIGLIGCGWSWHRCRLAGAAG